MFGWINDCTENLVVSKFGLDTWHRIKQEAGCPVEDGGFLRYKYYPDEDTVDLVVAASKVLDLTVADVLHAFGEYFVQYVQDNGYSNVLECLGSNLRDWLSNLNALHDHLQASYPKGFVAPVFWSQDDTENNGALLVQYYSKRGSLLVPLVVGLIKRIAVVYFDIEIDMEQLQMQGETDDAKHTSWRITAKDPALSYKLSGRMEERSSESVSNESHSSNHTNRPEYEGVFRQGGQQAADLRTEEFVQRCFRDPRSELYHALAAEHYACLVRFWKTDKIDGQWCYDKWTIDHQDPAKCRYPTLQDLPAAVMSGSFICPHLDQCPKTGKYPPDEQGNLQSLSACLRDKLAGQTGGALECPHMTQRDENGDLWPAMFPFQLRNDSTGLEKRVLVDIHNEVSLEAAILEHAPALLQEWSTADAQAVACHEAEQQCIVWDTKANVEFHVFTLSELKDTTTRQLVEFFFPTTESAKQDDPIQLIFKCVDVIPVGEDEEDI